jgi:hypothetical protein
MCGNNILGHTCDEHLVLILKLGMTARSSVTEPPKNEGSAFQDPDLVILDEARMHQTYVRSI